jgi:hypothetical protein
VVGYRPALRDEGLRLVPDGPLYRVLLPSAFDGTPTYPLDVWADDRVRIVGYDLPTKTVRAGDLLKLILYQSVTEPMGEHEYWMPYARLGSAEAHWTTDSRLNTPHWEGGETVVEAYDLPVPFHMPPGEYPLSLGYSDLSGARPELPLSTGETTVKLATITVLPNPEAPCEDVLRSALANLDNQVALMDAQARVGLQVRQGRWEKPLVVRPGQSIHLALTWRALAAPRDVHSQAVFVHLIDGSNQLVAGHDRPPLGGAFPTTLWFPKWLPGQTVDDPYQIRVPEGTPPGNYWIEAGMYGMTSLRRLPMVDLAGSLAGDRIILGMVQVKP